MLSQHAAIRILTNKVTQLINIGDNTALESRLKEIIRVCEKNPKVIKNLELATLQKFATFLAKIQELKLEKDSTVQAIFFVQSLLNAGLTPSVANSWATIFTPSSASNELPAANKRTAVEKGSCPLTMSKRNSM